MATANELRQLLKEDAAGKNLYDHLTETLMRIVLDRPANSYDAFELISSDVKLNPLNPDPEKGKPVPPSEDQVRIPIPKVMKLPETWRINIDLTSSSLSLSISFLYL
jgi:hypothetical protein